MILFIKIHIPKYLGDLHLFKQLAFGSWITWFISSWDANNCCQSWTNFKNDNYFCSKWQVLTFLSENDCHFALATVIFFSAWDKVLDFKSQHPTAWTYVDNLSTYLDTLTLVWKLHSLLIKKDKVLQFSVVNFDIHDISRNKDIKIPTNYAWLQIYKKTSWHMLSGTGLREKGGEWIITSSVSGITWNLSIGLNSVFKTVQFPTGIAHLNTSLANMNGYNFSHFFLKKIKKSLDTYFRN